MTWYHAVWPEDRIYGQGIRDDSLAQLVRRLREKIEPNPSAPNSSKPFPGGATATTRNKNRWDSTLIPQKFRNQKSRSSSGREADFQHITIYETKAERRAIREPVSALDLLWRYHRIPPKYQAG